MTYELRFRQGEIYADILTVDSFQRGNSVHQQADSLLVAKLMEHESMIVQRNRYLAWKRGITPAQMWLDILNGTAKPMSKEELAGLTAQGLIDTNGEVPGLKDSK